MIYFFNLFKNAFAKYPLAVLSFFFLSFLLFLNIANETFSPNAYFLIFVVAFSLLCEKITQIYSKNSLKSKFSPFFMVLFVSIVVYFLVFIHTFSTQKDTFKILSYHYFSIFIAVNFCVISVFVALSVRNSYEKFSAILAKFLIILFLYIVSLILLGILFGGMNFLFDVNNSNFFKTFSGFAVFFGFFAGVAFLGSKHSYLKIFNTLLLLLNIFAFAYIIVLAFYLISRIMLYFAGISAFKDIVHIVMWFAFFLLILAFLNKGFKEQSKLFKFYSFATLILSIVALLAIGVRIFEHSFTPARFFVLMLSFFIFYASLLCFFSKKALFYNLLLFGILSLFAGFISIPLSVICQKNRLMQIDFALLNKENFIKTYGNLEKESINIVLKERDNIVYFLNKMGEKIEYAEKNDEIVQNFTGEEIKKEKILYKSFFKDQMPLKFANYEMIEFNTRYSQKGAYKFKIDDNHLNIFLDDKKLIKIDTKELDKNGSYEFKMQNQTFYVVVKIWKS